MTTTDSNSPVMDQKVAQALLSSLRNNDMELRAAARKRIQELTTKAGGDALDFLLDPSKVALEQSAIDTDALAKGFRDSLDIYVSSLRHYCDVSGAVSALRDVIRTLNSHLESRRDEARTLSLKELTGHQNEIADGRNRKLAFSSHYRSQGTDEFLQLLMSYFGPVMEEVDAYQRK